MAQSNGTSSQANFPHEAGEMNPARMRLLIDISQDIFWEWDLESGDFYLSPRWEALMGYAPGEITPENASFQQIMHPDDYLNALNAFEYAIEHDLPGFDAEFRIRGKHGAQFWFFSRNRILRKDASGVPVHLAGILTDITAYRESQLDLQRRLDVERVISVISSRLANLTVERIDKEIHWVLSQVGELVQAEHCFLVTFNVHTLSVLGRHEWIAKPGRISHDLAPGSSLKSLSWLVDRLKNGEIWMMTDPEQVSPSAVEAHRFLQENDIQAAVIYPIFWQERLTGFFGFDTSQKGHTRKEDDVQVLRVIGGLLANSTERLFSSLIYTSLVNHSLQGLAIVQKEKFIFINQRITEICGYTLEELNHYPHIFEQSWEEIWEMLQHRIQSGKPNDLELKVRHKNSRELWIEVNSTPVLFWGEPAVQIAVLDITQQKQDAAEIVRLQNFFEKVAATAPLGILVINLKTGKMEFANTHILQGFNLGDLTAFKNQAHTSLVHPADQQRFIEFRASLPSIQEGEIRKIDLRFQQATDHYIEIRAYFRSFSQDAEGKVERVLVILEDVSEYRHLENQLIASHKMVGIGTLTAGLTHEINTPLQVLTGVSDAALNALKSEPVDLAYLQRALELLKRNSWRIAEVLQMLRQYAMPSTDVMEISDLNLIVRNTLLLVENQFRSDANITIRMELDPNLPHLVCSRSNIAQMLMNLLTNARDAMPGGGEIIVRTSCQPEKNQLVLEVIDTGTGIPEEIRQQIFDPFFSTRPLSERMGLGLSVVAGIIRAHNGKIEVESFPKKGSTFRVLLPLKTRDTDGDNTLPTERF
ncbi:MAG TPA: PAS domain-containing protein [Anaerolineaceae bacterium]